MAILRRSVNAEADPEIIDKIKDCISYGSKIDGGSYGDGNLWISFLEMNSIGFKIRELQKYFSDLHTITIEYSGSKENSLKISNTYENFVDKRIVNIINNTGLYLIWDPIIKDNFQIVGDSQIRYSIKSDDTPLFPNLTDKKTELVVYIKSDLDLPPRNKPDKNYKILQKHFKDSIEMFKKYAPKNTIWVPVTTSKFSNQYYPFHNKQRIRTGYFHIAEIDPKQHGFTY